MPKTLAHRQAEKLAKAERELEIQDALERIRKVALKMRTTDDIGTVAVATRDALHALGIVPWRTQINLVDEKRDRVTVYGCKRRFNFSVSPAILSTLKAAGSEIHQKRSRGKRWDVRKLNKRERRSELVRRRAAFADLRGGTGEKFNAWMENELKTAPNPYYGHRFFYSGGTIGLGMDRELEKDEVAIARRVTETFDFAYQRLVELQEKEERAREAEIEAALERVRSKAMGMETSADIKGVAIALRNEFAGLGYPIHHAGISTADVDAGTFQQWYALPATDPEADQGPPNTFPIKDIVHRASYKKIVAGVRHWTTKSRGKELEPLRKRLKQLGWTAGEIRERLSGYSDTVYNNYVNFGNGVISYGAPEPFEDADFAVADRFTDVFAFAYERFLDLQDKERRAREAEVEAALERVRSSALGMQESDEIKGVTTVLRNELAGLGFPMDYVTITIRHADPGMAEWWYASPTTTPDTSVGQSLVQPIDKLPLSRIEEWDKGPRSWVSESTRGQRAPTIRRNMKALGATKREIEKRVGLLPDRTYIHNVSFGDGVVSFGATAKFDETDLGVVERFSDVFAFAYRRFLDLQQKERRAREAEVEAAIERIRSQALAMETSEDLPSVAATLHREMRGLFESEMNVDNTVIGIVDEERNRVDQWVALPEDLSARWTDEDYVVDDVHVQVEWFELSALRSIDAYWKRAYRASGGRSVFLNTQYTLDEGIRIVNRLVKLGQWTAQRGKATETGFRRIYDSRDLIQVGHVQFKQGYILTLADEPYAESQIEELKRIGDVFAFAYDRFLDLQQKETQNRELTIQNALERVRARALGMQESTEIGKVAETLFTEFQGLGFPHTNANIVLYDEEANTCTAWFVHDRGGLPEHARKTSLLLPENAALCETDVYWRVRKKVVDAWKRGDQWCVADLEGSELRDFAAGDFRAHGASKRDAKARGASAVKQYGRVCFHRVFNQNGYLGLNTREPLDDELLKTAHRFSSLWAYAYGRFLELKQKEDQNRELTIQNGLERVRARAEGMQTTDDLPSVSAALFRELNALELPILASSVCVRDEERDLAYQWTTKPPGLKDDDLWKMGTVFEEDPPVFLEQYRISSQMKAVPWAAKAWETWKKTGQTVFTHTDRPQDIERYFDVFVKLGDWTPEVAAIWRKSAASGSIERTLILFKHGYFHCGQEGKLDASHLDTLTRFAEAFGFAYDRFLELKEKEAQNRELTVQNAIERVRARALGMQESEEIGAVATILFEELLRLGFDAVRSTIGIQDLEAGTYAQYQGKRAFDLDDAGRGTWSKDVIMKHWAGKLRPVVQARSPVDQAWLEGKMSHFLEVRSRKEAKTREMKGVFSDLAEWPADKREAYLDLFADGQYHYYFYMKYGQLSPVMTRELTEEEIHVGERFAAAFEFAYNRFLELKQKEDQNRELTIQNALERVRAQSQGMQESEEIAGVARAIYDEFQGLGYDLIRANVQIFGTEDDPGRGWPFYDQIRELLGLSEEELHARQPNRSMAQFHPAIAKARARGDWYVIARSEGKALKEKKRAAGREDYGLTGKALKAFVDAAADREVIHVVFHTHGGIMFVMEDEMSEQDLLVAKRFADVFDYAYGRFRELEEKEAQNRELTIQNSLERVRAQALGMQTSDDLPGVASTLHEQMTALGIRSVVTSIEIVERETGQFRNTATFGSGEFTPWMTTPLEQFREIPVQTRVLDAFDKGESVFTTRLEGAECREHQQFWINRTIEEFPDQPDPGFPDQSSISMVYAFFTKGWIYLELGETIGAWGDPDFQIVEGEPLGDADLEMVQRFAEVFGFAYDRFLELKQKEDQNRELTIQNAIERVRARAEGMQESTDVDGVSRLLSHELNTLLGDVRALSLTICDEESGVVLDSLQFEEHTETTPTMTYSLEEIDDTPLWHVKEIHAARKRGEDGYTMAWTREHLEAINAWFVVYHSSEGTGSEEVTFEVELPTYSAWVFNKVGWIGLSRPEPISTESMQIMRRFAEVFDYTYGRYRELKQKEEQNRELTIQNALERVRARAQGMQVSKELSSVVEALFGAFEELDYDLIRTSTIIFEGDDEVLYEKAGSRYQHIYPDFTEMRFPREAHEQQIQTFEWDRLEGLPDPWKGHLAEGDKLIAEESWWNKTLGIPDRSKAFAKAVDGRCLIYWCYLESNGTFTLTAADTLSEEQLRTAHRFVEVYDYSHGRFLELKQKEEQNRELTIQNALERVRARALGMQESGAIREVVWDLLEEVRELDLPVFRTMIGILDRDEAWIAHHYLGQEAGSVFVRPSQDPSAAEMIEGWRSAAGTEGWTSADLTESATRLRQAIRRKMKAAGISPEDIRAQTYPKGSVIHHRYFDRGVIGFDAEWTLAEDELAVLNRFVEMFGFAYNRFRELLDKEEQNRELTIQNALERVRARALGMQESEEIAGVARTLYDEFRAFGFDPIRLAITVYSPDGTSAQSWPAGDVAAEAAGWSDAIQAWRRPFTLEDPAFVSRMLEARKGGVPWTIRTTSNPVLGSEEWDRLVQLLVSRWEISAVEAVDYLQVQPEAQVEHRIFFEGGHINLVTDGTTIPDADLRVVQRFAEVFSFAYGRFRELEAKEEQNRELTIQNALERVRARALGMQESEELVNVSTTMLDELKGLGIPAAISSIGVRDRNDADTFRVVPTQDSGPAFLFTVTRDFWMSNSTLAEAMASWEGEEPWFEKQLIGQEAKAFETFWKDQGGLAFDRSKVTIAAVWFARGWLYLDLAREDVDGKMVAADPLDEDQLAMVKRFADTFDFAYGRFLELQQKEEQNRELAIQNALERVRSRALGMQESGELRETAKILLTEMLELGVDVTRSGISIAERVTEGIQVQVYNVIRRARIRRGRLEWLDDVRVTPGTPMLWTNKSGEHREWERGEKSFLLTHRTQEEVRKREADGRMSRDLSPDQLELYFDLFKEGQFRPYFFFKYGWLSPVLPRPLTDEEITVGERFAKAFEFAYERFLELQQKESQNRELAVEAALERVRSRALAMEGTDELCEVASLIREEVLGLGIVPEHIGISVREEGSSLVRQFRIDPDGSSHEITVAIAEADQHPTTKAVVAARAAGESYCHMTVDRDQVSTWVEMATVRSGKSPTPENYPERMETYFFIFERGALGLGLTEKLDGPDLVSMSRFADTFGFACDRYLQIEATERQNWQLRLDAALERVHANVASMQTTDDIGAMMGLVYREIEGLGIDLFSGNIIIVDEAARETQQYALIPQALYARGVEGEPVARDMVEGIDVFRGDRPIREQGDEIYDVWKSGQGEIGAPPSSPEDRERLVEGLKTQFGLTVPKQVLPRSVMRVPFSHGVLLFYAEEENAFSQDDLSAVRDFAEMVTLGYARYLDFQRLEDQNRELAEANEQVREATRLKSQFLATMSHELRTPMNAIIGFTKLVLRRSGDKLDGRQRENLEKVTSSADHLLSLINDILDLSKVEAGRIDIKASEFALKPLLESACATVGPTLGKAGVKVVCEVADDVPTMHTDEARLRQVVINLLSNALKFTDSGLVTVSAIWASPASSAGQALDTPSSAYAPSGTPAFAEASAGRQDERSKGAGEHVIISVADTGIGIPEDQLGMIFEEFRQVDGSSTRRHQGTGLGLAITKKLVELLGGTIEVESAVGEGSTFTIVLPVRYVNGGM